MSEPARASAEPTAATDLAKHLRQRCWAWLQDIDSVEQRAGRLSFTLHLKPKLDYQGIRVATRAIRQAIADDPDWRAYDGRWEARVRQHQRLCAVITPASRQNQP